LEIKGKGIRSGQKYRGWAKLGSCRGPAPIQRVCSERVCSENEPNQLASVSGLTPTDAAVEGFFRPLRSLSCAYPMAVLNVAPRQHAIELRVNLTGAPRSTWPTPEFGP